MPALLPEKCDCAENTSNNDNTNQSAGAGTSDATTVGARYNGISGDVKVC